MKVALAGPSGTGKTTLTKFIEDTTELKFTSNSALDLFTEEDMAKLFSMGYRGTGHKEVIELSMANYKFGGEFQRRLLLRRGEFIEQNDNFIIDRSPIDNLSYFMYQNGFLATEEFITEFSNTVVDYIKVLDIVIFIPTYNTSIENNGSRISNLYFQQMVSQIFRFCIHRFKLDQYVRIETINFWDLNKRKSFVTEVINSLK